MFIKIKNCPLCKSFKYKFFSKIKKNLYLEILSKITNLSEDFLIDKIQNNKCKNCGLIFKNFWFKDNLISKIYENHITQHPRGQDYKSQIF